jgi:hypothetical protein
MADVNQLIQNFYKVAQEREFARDFNFRVLSISTPGVTNAAGQPLTFSEETDLVYVKSASLPERSITNVQVPYMGLNFNIPGNATYPNSEAYNLTFYCDANSQIRQKFEDWSRYVFNDANSTGYYFTPGPTSVIDLVQLDNNMNKVAQYSLIGVSPRSVGAIDYNIADGNGAVLTFTATVAYHYFTRSV